MKVNPYNREKAAAYARRWAYGRNPAYFDFSGLGGDCTNFASQILYAGTGAMNYTPVTGWFYISADRRTASWTGVPYFYNFLTSNRGAGPFAQVTDLSLVEPGDFIQLSNGQQFYHTLAVVLVAHPITVNNVLVATHTFDTSGRPLGSYAFRQMRCLHIEGWRE